MRKTLTLVLLALLCICGYAQTIDPVLMNEMGQRTDDEKIRVVVIMKSQYDRQQLGRRAAHYTTRADRREFVVNELKQFAEASQYDLRHTLAEMERQDMATAPKIIWMANALYFSATKQAIHDLALRRDIGIIGLDEEKYALFDEESRPANMTREITSNVTQVNADQVWDLGYTGQGVVVAVIDTGVNYNHLDLADHLWDGGDAYPNHGYDFINEDNDPMDDHGHGSHCAGTVCGDGTAGKQTGMAPDATLMCVKVLSSGGSGYVSVTCDAMQWAVEQGCDLFSMSLGWANSSITERTLFRNTCVAVLDAGVVGAIAAGNEGDDLVNYPIPNNVRVPGSCPPPYMDPIQGNNSGDLSCSICIGAVDADDAAAYFTSHGPVTWSDAQEFGDYPYTSGSSTEFGLIRPDVCAPGVSIISANYSNNSGYTTKSGTSMATPCVAGCISLLLSKNIDATPAEICQVLEETAVPLAEGKSNIYGYGRVDVLAAINALYSGPLTLDSFTVNDNSGNNNGKLNPGEAVTLDITLMNDSEVALDGATLVLSTESEYVTITNGTATLPHFNAGQTQTIENIFAFTLDDDAPAKRAVQFIAEAFVNGESLGTMRISVMVYNYTLKINEFTVLNDSNSNGSLEAGETANLHVVISNIGNDSAYSIVGTLSASYPYLTINSAVQTFGNIEVNGQAYANFNVTLADNAPEGYTIDFSLDLVDDNDNHSILGFELWKKAITLTSNPEEGGVLSGGGYYGQGQACTITATPNDGYVFCSWTENGEVISLEPNYSFIMTDSRSFVANFIESQEDDCYIVINLNDSYGDGWNGNKLVVSYSTGCLDSEQFTFETGYSASFTRKVVNGSHIVLSWITGSYANECSFTVSYEGDLLIYQSSGTPSAGVLYEFDCNCAAASQVFMVNVASENTAYGTVSGGGEYTYGQICTVTATPAEGYYFSGWSNNDIMISGAGATYSFNVNSDMNLVAHFSEGFMIGDGSEMTNSYLPSYSYYNYTLSQQIYTAEELGTPGMISGIAFYNGGTVKTRTYDFYMKATTKSSFTSSTDWETVSTSDRVFSGSVIMEANVWTLITFDTPFFYDGSSNVVLVADDNTGSWSSGMSCRVFDAPNQALRIYSDNTDYDPFNPSSYTGAVLSVKNQLIVTREGFSDCMIPAQLTATEVGPDFVKLSWTELGASEQWYVSYGDSLVMADTNEDFLVEGLEPETSYTFMVRPACDENLFSAPFTVTTLEACPVPQNVEVGNITGNAATVTWSDYSDSYNVQLGCSNIQVLLSEDFSDEIPADWTNDATYPWTIVDGHIQSGNAGVASSTSSISVTMTYPADGTISFDFWSRGEGSDSYNWDKSRFYIDDELMFDYGQHTEWESYSTVVSAGTHTFTWTYKKDGSVNPAGDCFIVDNVEMESGGIIWNDPVSVGDAEYTFIGLTPTTDYYARVQGICGDTETEWSEPVHFTTTEITTVTQTITLSEGWNWSSTNVEITLNDLKSALVAALPGTNIIITSQSNGSTTYNGSTWRGNLSTLDVKQMYMIQVSAACEITLTGMPINPALYPITIHNGVNWIAFPLGGSMTLSNAFSGFAVNGDMVLSQFGSATYNGSTWRGALNTLAPGQGYMYKSNVQGDRTFAFPISTK